VFVQPQLEATQPAWPVFGYLMCPLYRPRLGLVLVLLLVVVVVLLLLLTNAVVGIFIALLLLQLIAFMPVVSPCPVIAGVLSAFATWTHAVSVYPLQPEQTACNAQQQQQWSQPAVYLSRMEWTPNSAGQNRRPTPMNCDYISEW
jgi:hypothetical protein